MSSRGFCWRSLKRGPEVLHELNIAAVEIVVRHARLGVEVEGLVDPAADHVAVLGGHAEQRGDHVGRDPGPEVLHVVEGAPPDQAVEQVGAERADVLFEELHAARREGLGDEAPVAGVLRRVHEDHHLHLDRVRRDHLHDGAVRGDERLGVAAEGVDLGEAAHGVEVVLLVVVERLLVAQPLPDGVRVAPCTSRRAGPRRGARCRPRSRREPAQPDVVGVPELDAAEDARRVVDHGDALEHVAEVAPVDARTRCRRRCRGGRRWSARRGRRWPCAPACSSACRRSSCAPARPAAR